MRIGRSSSSPQPRVTTARAMLAADVGAALALHLESVDRPAGPTTTTRVTPGIAASTGAASAPCASTCTYSVSAPLQPRGQVLRRVDGDDPALVDDDDALAGLRDLGKDVRAEDDRVVAGEAANQLARLDDLLRVEARGRLVEDQHLRVVNQRLGEADALPVALRELAQWRSAMSGRGSAASPSSTRALRSFGGTPLMRATKSRYSRTVMSG